MIENLKNIIILIFRSFLLYDSRVKTFGNEPTDKVFARELKKRK